MRRIFPGMGNHAVLMAGLTLGLGSGASPAPCRAADTKIDFNRDVRPILSDTCFACHGPDEKQRKAGLRLDTAEGIQALLESGEHAVVPGQPEDSELVFRVETDDAELRMPPKSVNKSLSVEQVQTLRRWVEQGAKWSLHWAFSRPERPPVPTVKNPSWIRNPIDAFVLAKLEQEGLSPAPEVDKTTLMRRVSLDLTGLPATPADVDAFLADTRPDAYERLVDRLLDSPHYGERMAMQWLDGARYADSNGYQADYERFMWRWRDWVIDAFNRNLPFDRFTVEQLAGDLLPDATLDQKIATGFNRNHRINTEGGIIAEEWHVETIIDRIETTSTVWMGLTMGCARCHDHKYDPFTQKEFYKLFAFFNNVPETGVGVERPVNHPPLVQAPRPADRDRLASLNAALAAAEKSVAENEPKLAALQDQWERTFTAQTGAANWVTLDPTEARSAGTATLARQADGSILATGTNPPSDVYTITAPTDLKQLAAVRLEALPEEGLAGKGPGRSVNGNMVLTGVTLQACGQPVKLVRASADFSQEGYAVARAIDDKADTGWAIFPKVGEPHAAIFAPEKPVELADHAQVTLALSFQSEFERHQLGRFRLALSSVVPPEVGAAPANIVAIVGTPPDRRTDAQKAELRAYFRANHAGELAPLVQAAARARKERDDFEAAIPTVMVMEEMAKPRTTYFLIRGQYDKRGEPLEAGLPAALPPLPADAPRNRLGLARWLVDPAHPLTARVAVNRFWERFFGNGIVKSSENLGTQGEWPSHPELLDWLATEFIQVGWDMKAIQKLIVTSNTYKQSSNVTPALREKDPDNRLLARGPRFRLPAEVIRDQALAIAGLLNEEVGGPSVRPYQPEGIWDETNVYGNLRNYQHDKGPGLYRRSMYTIWKRTAAPPQMLLFDAPGRELCTVRRARTNTPLQALTLLNDETFVEASRVLAQRMIAEGGDTPERRIAFAFRRATSREPTEAETRVLAEGTRNRLNVFRANPDAAKKLIATGDAPLDPQVDAAELAAYTLTASVLLNLDETLTKE